MSKLCPNCHYIGKGKCGNFLYEFLFCSLSLGLMFIALGIVNLIRHSDISVVNLGWEGLPYIFIYIALISFPFLLGGINIFNYFRGGKICPKCKSKPMLSLDSPEAIKLIKEYDLKVGENSSKQSTPQST